jgi:hypothetical protein
MELLRLESELRGLEMCGDLTRAFLMNCQATTSVELHVNTTGFTIFHPNILETMKSGREIDH